MIDLPRTISPPAMTSRKSRDVDDVKRVADGGCLIRRTGLCRRSGNPKGVGTAPGTSSYYGSDAPLETTHTKKNGRSTAHRFSFQQDKKDVISQRRDPRTSFLNRGLAWLAGTLCPRPPAPFPVGAPCRCFTHVCVSRFCALGAVPNGSLCALSPKVFQDSHFTSICRASVSAVSSAGPGHEYSPTPPAHSEVS